MPSGPNPCGLRPPEPGELRRAEDLLRPFVEQIRRLYLRQGLDKVKGTRWRVTPDARDGGRHFAFCRTDGGELGFAPEMILLPTATARGIIAHEFGHAADYLYPAQFLPGPGGRLYPVRTGQRSNDGVPPARYNAWVRRGYDEIERAADAIAEGVLGERIGYAGPCHLETIGAGVRPRPKGLR